MMRYLFFIVFSTFLNVVTFAQGVTAFHDVQSTGENSYTIKTTVSGLNGVDIARITYYIDNTHTYIASPNNAFFSDRSDKFVKFYIMAIPNSGEITIELGVKLVGSGEFAFPVEFQYSKNEEKKSINFPQINIAGEAVAVVEETPSIDEIEKQDPSSEVINEDSLEEKIKNEEQEQLAKEKAEAAAKKEAEEKAFAEKIAKEKEEEAKKAEAEKIAKENQEAEALAKAEEEKRLAEEKAKAEKLVAEQKEKEEAEALAKAEEARRKAEEKATERAEEVVVEETSEVTEEEAQPQVVITPTTSTSKSNANYSIQILSLSKFSQYRLDNFIKQHHLDKDKIIKRKVGEWTKISYGKLNSKDEAREMIQLLRRNHNITDSFMVTLP